MRVTACNGALANMKMEKCKDICLIPQMMNDIVLLPQTRSNSSFVLLYTEYMAPRMVYDLGGLDEEVSWLITGPQTWKELWL